MSLFHTSITELSKFGVIGFGLTRGKIVEIICRAHESLQLEGSPMAK